MYADKINVQASQVHKIIKLCLHVFDQIEQTHASVQYSEHIKNRKLIISTFATLYGCILTEENIWSSDQSIGQTLGQENPHSNLLLPMLNLGRGHLLYIAIVYLLLGCINEYLVIDSGGYLYEQSALKLIAVWVNVSQRS